jgi:hypothetical protein
MVSGLENLGNFITRQYSADGKAIAEGFGDCHDIGNNSIGLVSEHFSATAHATLDFVKYQEEISGVAQLTQTLQEGRFCWNNSALTLDWFDHDGAGFFRQFAVHAVEVVKLRMDKSFRQRIKTLFDFILTGGSDGG